ncbi:DUF3606 domain-containing protein [Phenylobacterium deserti]|uniref:DUF3606 domain-containing protein n=1 Tax=Phenylobacterium deserti TaxID=1914756 RepID=UPI00197C8306|nr:DUF3606 domain-containing protein [Phenylobacterium deserti]
MKASKRKRRALFEASRTIDLRDADQVRYWAKRFGASPQELAEAVDKVGPNTTAVALQLSAPLS